MRIKLHLSPPGHPGFIPFNYQHQLTGAFHRILGKNKVHDETSLYSLGWLSRGTIVPKKGFAYPKGATWTISFYDDELAFRFLANAHRDGAIAFGMHAYKFESTPTPRFSGTYRFMVQSPVLVRESKENGPADHVLFSDIRADALLTKTFRNKMKLAGLTEEDQSSWMGFDRSYTKAKEKLVTIKESELKASECPILVSGTPNAVRFAWNVGAGHLTGSCFGHLK